MSSIVWCSHPRHLPKPPPGRCVMLDVAFAAGAQWRSKTQVFLNALGPRLVRFIDHHEHKEAWHHYASDARFLLVPNRTAHACPELVTPALVSEAGPIDSVIAHADFDGALAAAKWMRAGVEPWPSADEDARAVDSPGRGHALSSTVERIARAMDEASARYARPEQLRFMTVATQAIVQSDFSAALDDEIDTLGRAAHDAERDARELASKSGSLEAKGVFVVRIDKKPDNRTRRNLLLFAEERARIGVLHEPDPQGGSWMIAATFDEALDLEKVDGFEGGRSDYRFARAHDRGVDLVEALSAYAAGVPERAITPSR